MTWTSGSHKMFLNYVIPWLMKEPPHNGDVTQEPLFLSYRAGIAIGTANTVNDSSLYMDTNVWFERIQEELTDFTQGGTKGMKVFPDEDVPKNFTNIPQMASKLYESLKKKNIVSFPKK